MRAIDGESADFSAADEQHIRELLAAQPRPAMPADVADRITAALAAEPHPAFAAPDAPTGPSRLKWLGAAVAAAVVVLAGVIVVPQWRQGTTSTAETAPSAPATSSQREGTTVDPADPAAVGTEAFTAADCGNRPLAYDTGTRYQQAALTTQAQALVPQECGGGTTADAQVAATAAAPMPAEAAERNLKCIVRVARSPQIIVIDSGSYEGTPAVVAVVGPPQRALAVNCTARPVEVLMDVTLP